MKWAFVIVAVVGAFFADVPVARFVHEHRIDRAVEGKHWAQVVKTPGTFWFAGAVVIALLVCRQIDWRQGVYVLLADAVSGVNGLLKWFVGQHRPYKPPGTTTPRPLDFEPFWHGWHGLFHQVDLSFPSGHICTVTATMIALSRVWRPARWPGVIVVAAVMFERVAENAHYVDNVVIAVVIGWASATVARFVLRSEEEPRGFEVVPSRSM